MIKSADKEKINKAVSFQLESLNSLLAQKDGEWDNNFQDIYLECQEKMIYDFENFLTLKHYTFDPKFHREFLPNTESDRIEIKKIITDSFLSFKKSKT